jgi:hypothetical protein
VHPIEEIFSTDSVVVLPQPDQPIITAPNGLSACIETDVIQLLSSQNIGNQWFRNEISISGATNAQYVPGQTAIYHVQVTNAEGCTAISDNVAVTFNPLPSIPFFVNDRNNLELFDSTFLPTQYALQWIQNGDSIPGATGFDYCASESGNYGLQVLDLATGCSNFFSANVVYDPSFDCSVGIKTLPQASLSIFPNPANDMAMLKLNSGFSINDGRLRVWDKMGRLLQTTDIQANIDFFELNCAIFPAGTYTVEIVGATVRMVGKLVLLH